QATLGGGTDAFVAKLNSGGSALVYSTYLGGNSNDQGSGIAVDSSGNAYVTGSTSSANFPTTAASFQPALRGGSDAFIIRIRSAAVTIDFDGDGKADILWRNTNTGDNAIFRMNGFTLTSSALIPSVPTTWTIAGVGDFDGDGKADILWRNTNTGDNAIFLMNGFTLTSSALIPSVPTTWTIAGVGAFDADAKLFRSWRNTNTGDNAIFRMNGFTLTSSALIPSVPTTWTIAGVGDYDGDGKADILWRNTSTGDNAIF